MDKDRIEYLRTAAATQPDETMGALMVECLNEITRLRDVLEKIITESGKVDINNWPAQQQICQSIAQEALS